MKIYYFDFIILFDLGFVESQSTNMFFSFYRMQLLPRRKWLRAIMARHFEEFDFATASFFHLGNKCNQRVQRDELQTVHAPEHHRIVLYSL